MELESVHASDFDLLVLGDCKPDLVLSGDQVEPAFGQIERLVDAADLTIGGSAGILACGAARLGLRTALVGIVGDDLFGSFMCTALAQRGVDTRGIVVDPGARTGLTVILGRPGDRAILTFPGTISVLGDGGIRDLLAATQVFLPNAQEATRIAGRADPGDAARALAALGPLTAVKLARMEPSP
jgi:sugar/nucleoside kinase (ribokinase family)